MSGRTSEFINDHGRIVATVDDRYLVEVEQDRLQGIADHPSVEVRLDYDKVHLKNRTLDIALLAPEDAILRPQTRMLLVHFKAPPTGSDCRVLNKSGYKVLSYVPNNTLLVWDSKWDLVSRSHRETLTETPIEIILPYQDDDKIINTAEEMVRNGGKLPFRLTAVAAQNIENEPEIISWTEERVSYSRLQRLKSYPHLVSIDLLGEPMLLAKKDVRRTTQERTLELRNSIDNRWLEYISQQLETDHVGEANRYPIAIFLDDGIDNGGSGVGPSFPFPSRKSFYSEGDIKSNAGMSRIAFSFSLPWNRYTNHLNRPLEHVASYEDDHESEGQHGTLLALIAAGRGGICERETLWEKVLPESEIASSETGVSPYGRIANVKLIHEKNSVYPESFEPEDMTSAMYFAALEAHELNSFFKNAHPTLLTNISWGVKRDFLTPESMKRKSTSDSWYDTYCVTLDKMTRRIEDPMGADCLEGSLFVVSGDVYQDDQNGILMSPGYAKNALTVGTSGSLYPALSGTSLTEYFNSDVPQKRIKPDIRIRPNFEVDSADKEVPASMGERSNPLLEGAQSAPSSFAAATVTGLMQLLAFQLREQDGIVQPSPSILRALAINSSSPPACWRLHESLDQSPLGFGYLSPKELLNHKNRVLINEEILFTRNSESTTFVVSPVDPTKPVSITLAWTDGANELNASGTGYDLMNDLNLRVKSGKNHYAGNHFRNDRNFPGPSRSYSEAPVNADRVNNVEKIVLFNSDSEHIEVTVEAERLVMDALSNDPFSMNFQQDFSLVISNAEIHNEDEIAHAD